MRDIKMLTSFIVSLVLTLFVGIAIRAADKQPQKPTDPALVCFIENTKAYLQLRNKVEKSLPPLKAKASPAEIRAHEQMLRLKMATARDGVSQGSIFTPQAVPVLKRIINSETQGPGGKTARKTVLESSPKAIPCTINGAYPADEPVSTIPPDLLMKLPQLPDNLEYRFVQRSLILRDAKANMIVDCLPNALPLSNGNKANHLSAEKKTPRKTEKKAE